MLLGAAARPENAGFWGKIGLIELEIDICSGQHFYLSKSIVSATSRNERLANVSFKRRDLKDNSRSVRQAKPGRRGSLQWEAETPLRDPVGNQSYPAKRAGSRNRVLRGCGVTHAAKRTQGVCRPCD